MEALKVPTTSMILFSASLSWSVVIFKDTWKEPLEGESAQRTFWMR